MTQSEILANIRRDRAQLDALVARVGEARMAEPALEDGWSVKDVLAHITAWEQLCLGWIRSNTQPEGPFDAGSLNALNMRIYDTNRNRGLADVVAEAGRSYAEMLAMVERQPEDALAVPPAWSTGTLAQIISVNADAHYREHIAQIERWLGGA